jgi:hypothetical protein
MITDTNDEIAALKNQVFILLIALIVVSGTLTVFLYRQVSLANKDITQDKILSSQIVTNEVVFRKVVVNLVNYGEKHPDLLPVLKKYGLGPNSVAAPVAPRK